MKRFLPLALVASLSACASFEVRPPTEASIAKAADRAVNAETAYAVLAEITAFGAGAFDPATRAKIANGDSAAFATLVAVRKSYPVPASLSPADAVRIANAVDRSDAAHTALQLALSPPT